jgi:O-antigen ligase
MSAPMFVLPGIGALLTLVYVRPQEVFEILRPVTVPSVVLVVVLGYVLDVRAGITRPRPTLLLGLQLAFFSWALLTVAVKAPGQMKEHMIYFLAASMVMSLATSQGLQTLRGFWAVANILLVITLFLASVGIHQGLSQKVCIDSIEETLPAGTEFERPPCKTRMDCVETGILGHDYLCEHVGLFRTTSVGGRVRYRGIFQDPNELAWALNMILPFAFAWFERRRSLGRLTGVILMTAACITCNVMTRSRSGQLALLATLGVYFVRRLGRRGLVIGGVLALPVAILGGRSDEASTLERLECWAEALGLWRENPFMGIGARQFGEYHYLTAHNSFVLSLAELGPVGLMIWTAVLYLALKITIQVQRDFAGRPEAQAARGAAFALMAGLVGLVTSAMFLSITYHAAFWIQIGLAGAVQGAVQRHDPTWRVRWRWIDTALVAGIDVFLLSAIAFYLRWKGV